jgi:hypothetical protein
MAYYNPKLEVTDEVLKRMGVDPSVRQAKKTSEAAAEEK